MPSKNGKPNRPPGRPKKGQEAITVEDYYEIASLYGRGWSFNRIAKKFGVHIKTVQDVFRRHILPAQRVQSTHPREAQLLKLQTMFSIAWECFERDAPFETREQIKEELQKGGAHGRVNGEVIEKITSRIKRPNMKGWLDLALEIAKEQNRIQGLYAPMKVEFKTDEYRVAGQSADQTNTEMMKRLSSKIIERRQYEADLREAGIELGPSEN